MRFPLYRPISKTAKFNAYPADDFDDREQLRLRDVFVEASKLGVLQMLSFFVQVIKRTSY